MENLFGKVLDDYKSEENLKTIIPKEALKPLDEKAERYIREESDPNNSEHRIAEKLAAAVFDCMESLGYFKSLFVYSDTDLKEAFKFDLKLLIILTFYFEQISYKEGFPENSPYISKFKDKYTFKSNKQAIFKVNDNRYPLEQFFLRNEKSDDNEKETMQIHNFIDMALSIALLGSSSASQNIYRKEASINPTVVNNFLQLFKYAYIDTTRIAEFLHELKNVKVSLTKGRLDPKSKYVRRNHKIKEWVDKNRNNISPEGYAILNQFCIERLTNINYIISLFDYRKNYFDLFAYSKYGLVLTYWLVVPLLKTRGTLLRHLKKHNGKLILQDNQLADVEAMKLLDDTRHILEEIIPIACGLYFYLMNKHNGNIPKDDKYFTDLYVNPAKYTDDAVEGYIFFATNSEKGNDLIPVEKFCFRKKSVIDAVLNELIKKTVHPLYLQNTDYDYKIGQLFQLYRDEYNVRIDKSLRAKRCDLFSSIKSREKDRNDAEHGIEKPEFMIVRSNEKYKMGGKHNKIEELDSEINYLKSEYACLCKKIKKTPLMSDIENIFEKLGLMIIPDGNESVRVTDGCSGNTPCYKCSLEDSLFRKKGLLETEFSYFLKEMIVHFDNETEKAFNNTEFLPTKNSVDHVLQMFREYNYAKIMNPDVIKCFKELELISDNFDAEVSHNIS